MARTLTVKDYVRPDIFTELGLLVGSTGSDDLHPVPLGQLNGKRSYGTRSGRDVSDAALALAVLRLGEFLPRHVGGLSRHPCGTGVGTPGEALLVLEDFEGRTTEEFGIVLVLLFRGCDTADIGRVG